MFIFHIDNYHFSFLCYYVFVEMIESIKRRRSHEKEIHLVFGRMLFTIHEFLLPVGIKRFFPPPIKFQTEKEIEITVPKDQISPESTYDKGEVPVYRTDTSVIYLKKVIQSADEPEFIILAFDILYQFEGKEQKILLPYKIEGEGDNLSYTNSIYTNNTVIDGDGKIFQDAIHISSQGPNQEFSFVMQTDTLDSMKESITFTVEGFQESIY